MSESCPLTRIVLASASPRRLELLRSLGLDVAVAPSGYHEPDAPHLSPAELATAHAREKLAAAMAKIGESPVPVVAADTVVDVDGVALNKPSDAAEAVRMLQMLSGREHLVHTAFTLAAPGGQQVEERATTVVRFYRLSPEEIADYVATGEPLDKAGAYGIQGLAAVLVESIAGDFYTVMGFPLGRFIRALRRLGFMLPLPNTRIT
ncbi:MAG TPA: Maf family protein [Candidatus Baltobacteraceae bacterium]|nr:Maf family protein [Candidatus Baltobacteraceae bacterium]